MIESPRWGWDVTPLLPDPHRRALAILRWHYGGKMNRLCGDTFVSSTEPYVLDDLAEEGYVRKGMLGASWTITIKGRGAFVGRHSSRH